MSTMKADAPAGAAGGNRIDKGMTD